MDEFPVVEIAEHQRADRRAGDGRRHISGNHELLALGALRFDPALASAGAIRRVANLGDYAFKAEAAGMEEYLFAVALEMLAIAHGVKRLAMLTPNWSAPPRVDRSGLRN
jgi:hypothetical protein